jgi:RecA/RadA recombinase
MFYLVRPMATLSPDVTAAVASLQARWGAAAPRVSVATDGALALAPATAPAIGPVAPTTAPAQAPATTPLPAHRPDVGDRIIPTGFAALDAILEPGGLPRSASVAIRGDGSSGRTTLVLRPAAEAQVAGSIVAWLDLSRSFDPVEAVARGVRLEWLVVITPETLDEGLAIGGALLAGRSVDLLVLDLPGGRLAATDKPTRIADRLGRLAALARRSETLFVVLEPPGLAGGLATAVAESTALRLELARRSWIRLGRDVVGQRTEALVARNRYGPPGRRATLRILYAEGGERDACLGRDDLLAEEPPTDAPAIAPAKLERTHRDATPPSPPAAPPPRARPGASLRTLPGGTAHPGRPAVGSGSGRRREPGRPGAGRPAGDAARDRAPSRP